MYGYLKTFLVYRSATEAHDDDGLPHTLEHIVFMGSEKYPYKVSYCYFKSMYSGYLLF